MKSLSCVKRGATVNIRNIEKCSKHKRHLEEMGFIPGTAVSVCRCCNKGPLVVAVRGGKIILGQEMARDILVE